MARKKKQPECPAGEKWAVPYADFLSLLLALFIALYAISAQNKSKVEALKQEFIRIFDAPPKPDTLQPVTPIPPNPGDIQDVTDGQKTSQAQNATAVRSVESIIQIEQLIQEGGVLEQVEQGVTLRLPSNLIFERNSAEITSQEMRDYIRDIAEIIKRFPPHVQINIRGYTDNGSLPKNSPYKSHFDLAAARAKAVMDVFIQSGINPSILSFTSYGINHPIAPNNSLRNRTKNNRVEIFFSADPNSVKNIQSILDSAKK